MQQDNNPPWPGSVRLSFSQCEVGALMGEKQRNIIFLCPFSYRDFIVINVMRATIN